MIARQTPTNKPPVFRAGMVELVTWSNTAVTTPILPLPRSWSTGTKICTTTLHPRPSSHSILGTRCTGWAPWTTAPTPPSNRYLQWFKNRISRKGCMLYGSNCLRKLSTVLSLLRVIVYVWMYSKFSYY